VTDLIIKPMSRDDLLLAVDWAAEEGWNPGLDDVPSFLAADPGGYLMVWAGGAPVACVSAVRYGEAYGFLGFYIAPPEFRGQGFGIKVWDAAIEQLGARVVGLDGVPDQQANYAQSGFVLAHRNVRYGGKPDYEPSRDPRLVNITGVMVPSLITYDRLFVPAARDAFLTSWATPTATRFGVALVEDGEISGYGIIRQCREGWKIGPLFATNEKEADLLFSALVDKANARLVYLDPPEPNAAAVALAIRHGLEPSFETARMYKGAAPDLPLDRTFGITTFELG